MSEQLILVRHGETLHNVAGIAQGWADSELSDKGQEQVRRLGERLRRHKCDALFASPLGRALTTATAIRDILGLEITVLEDLREMSYGDWESRSFLDIRRDDAGIYERWIVDPEERSPNGESHGEVRRRMERAFEAVSAAKRPLLVTHGTAIRIGATALLDVPVMASRNFAQDNAAINVFFWRVDRWVLKTWNDTTHCIGI
ncbi:MAG TPA: histidine phosphatase family protein [Thermoanaerobaculia bacterium]|nr:histidine phosphatase family protein [Thermoanaerobaculia bacterium]